MPITIDLKKRKERLKARTALILFYKNFGFNVLKLNDVDQSADMELVFVDEKKEEKKFISVVAGGTA